MSIEGILRYKVNEAVEDLWVAYPRNWRWKLQNRLVKLLGEVLIFNLTPVQIIKLKHFYEEHTGKKAEEL